MTVADPEVCIFGFARDAGEVGRGSALASNNFGQKLMRPSESGPTSEAYNVVGLIEGICDAPFDVPA